jgi:type IV secretion system protein TrbL
MLQNESIHYFDYFIYCCFSAGAFAELAYIDPATNQSVLDQVIQKFGNKVKSWQTLSSLQPSVCSGRWY